MIIKLDHILIELWLNYRNIYIEVLTQLITNLVATLIVDDIRINLIVQSYGYFNVSPELNRLFNTNSLDRCYDIINEKLLDFSHLWVFLYSLLKCDHRISAAEWNRVTIIVYVIPIKSEFLSRFPWFKFYLFAHQDGFSFFFALTHSFPSCFFLFCATPSPFTWSLNTFQWQTFEHSICTTAMYLSHRGASLSSRRCFFVRLYFIYFKRNSQLDLSIKNKKKQKKNIIMIVM